MFHSRSLKVRQSENEKGSEFAFRRKPLYAAPATMTIHEEGSFDVERFLHRTENSSDQQPGQNKTEATYSSTAAGEAPARNLDADNTFASSPTTIEDFPPPGSHVAGIPSFRSKWEALHTYSHNPLGYNGEETHRIEPHLATSRILSSFRAGNGASAALPTVRSYTRLPSDALAPTVVPPPERSQTAAPDYGGHFQAGQVSRNFPWPDPMGAHQRPEQASANAAAFPTRAAPPPPLPQPEPTQHHHVMRPSQHQHEKANRVGPPPIRAKPAHLQSFRVKAAARAAQPYVNPATRLRADAVASLPVADSAAATELATVAASTLGKHRSLYEPIAASGHRAGGGASAPRGFTLPVTSLPDLRAQKPIAQHQEPLARTATHGFPRTHHHREPAPDKTYTLAQPAGVQALSTGGSAARPRPVRALAREANACTDVAAALAVVKRDFASVAAWYTSSAAGPAAMAEAVNGGIGSVSDGGGLPSAQPIRQQWGNTAIKESHAGAGVAPASLRARLEQRGILLEAALRVDWAHIAAEALRHVLAVELPASDDALGELA